MPANAVTVTAVFDTMYNVYVVSAGTGAIGSGIYVVGKTVSINAGTAPTGRRFKIWTTTSNGVTFVNANNASTSFTMPRNAVRVTAVFGYDYNYSFSCGTRPCTTTVIGGKTWMAENLNYEVANGKGSWCYGSSPDSCTKYGRLYNWNTAMDSSLSSTSTPSGVQGVCPNGWHLPSHDEWQSLVDSTGGNDSAGKKLKSTSYWQYYDGHTGTNDSRFSALPGGHHDSGSFYGVGEFGYWWTSTEDNSGLGYYRRIGYSTDNVNEFRITKDNGYSVRCVADR